MQRFWQARLVATTSAVLLDVDGGLGTELWHGEWDRHAR